MTDKTVQLTSNEEVYLVALKRIANMDGHNISTTARAIAKQAIAFAPETPVHMSASEEASITKAFARSPRRAAQETSAPDYKLNLWIPFPNKVPEGWPHLYVSLDDYEAEERRPSGGYRAILHELPATATAQETCDAQICWACQGTYAGPRSPDGKCPRCASGTDPVQVIAWVGFPNDEPRPHLDIIYDNATKLLTHQYVAIYGIAHAQKASEPQIYTQEALDAAHERTRERLAKLKIDAHSRDCDCHDCHYSKKHPQIKPHHALCGCFECASLQSASETTAQLTEAETLLQAWADPLPPNGKLYWEHVNKARQYFKDCAQHRPAQETIAPHTTEDDYAHWLSYSGKGKRATAEQLRDWREAYFAGVEPTQKAGTGQCYLHPESTCPTPCQGGRKCVLEPAKANAQSFEVRNGPAQETPECRMTPVPAEPSNYPKPGAAQKATVRYPGMQICRKYTQNGPCLNEIDHQGECDGLPHL